MKWVITVWFCLEESRERVGGYERIPGCVEPYRLHGVTETGHHSMGLDRSK
jgi:hypothetical protein